jgi:tRNA dimethylallyltransferase
MNPKLLIICGPTATGKTALALKIAQKYNGEIISADSRQVYQDMDIVTGKDLPKNSKLKTQNSKLGNYYLSDQIRIWGLDLAKPDEEFSVAHYQKYVCKIIKDIQKRKKLPILVGGTGLYIKAIVEGIDTIGIPPNPKLRKTLQKLSLTELQNYLKKINPTHFNKLNRSDRHNSRRLIRAIEIAPHQQSTINNQQSTIKTKNILIIGLKSDNQTLYQRIDKRVLKRIKKGAQKEIKNLLKKGYSWKLPSMSALGYRQWRSFFEGKETKKDVIQKWKFAEHAYARRQLTWFKKALRQAQGKQKVSWFDISQPKWQTKIDCLVNEWYNQK